MIAADLAIVCSFLHYLTDSLQNIMAGIVIAADAHNGPYQNRLRDHLSQAIIY